MNFYAWTGLINTLTTALASMFVLSRHQRDSRHITFVFFTISVAAWSFFYFLWQLSTTERMALLLCRGLMIGCFFIPVTFVHHVATLVGVLPSRRVVQFIRWGYFVAVLLFFGNFGPLVFREVAPRLSFRYWPLPGPLGHFYMVWFFVYIIYAIRLMYRGYVSASGPLRNQLRYLLIGTLFAFAGGSTNFFLWYDIPIPPVGNVVVPFYIILAALAAIRYQLMDIKVAITRTGLLLATYLVVLGLPFMLGWWGKEWLRQHVGEQWWLIPLGLSTVLATIGPFAYAYLRRQAERLLLKEQRRYQRTLQHAARGMTQVRDLTKLVRLIVRVVSRTVRIQHASLFLWDKDVQRYLLVASHGPKRFSLESRYGLENDHALIRWLRDARHVLSREELTRTPVCRAPARAASSAAGGEHGTGRPQLVVEQELTNLDAVLVVPGFIEHELVGFLALGEKLSGAGYSPDDLNAFSMLAHEAAIAIENARSYGELLKANEQLRLAYERLLQQERLVAAGQFATGMAHEIKNPLSAIKTFAEYLPEKYQDASFREKFFRIVQGEIDRINTIVKELLDFAKPAPLRLEPVAMSRFLEESLALLSNQMLKQDVELRTAFHENGLTVQADPKQLRQVVLNLLLNSLEAMPAGGRLEVDTSVQDDQLILKIADSGCGIPEDHQHKLFDPFFTTKERGMGLGLAIVKGVVERHGGAIFIRSRPGAGTTVEVALPVAGQMVIS